jgi:serine protease Do
MKKISFLVCSLLLIVGLPALAQATTLNPNTDPIFGTAVLNPSFQPDPYIVSLFSGGNLDVSAMKLGEICQGFAASAPDYRLVWGGDGSTPLRVFFIGNGDATLIINRPDGEWACNDDFSAEDLNPFVQLDNAPAGQYDIWVGSFAAATNVSGYLMITEVDSYPGRVISPLLAAVVDPMAVAQGAGGGGAGGLDVSQDANFGSVELNPGFAPDPHTVYVVSGGSLDISTLGLGLECRGFATSTPDYRLVLTGDVGRLRIFFVAQAGGDTTLVVNQADGTWACNDDFAAENLNPMVEIPNAPAGVYEIWVGSFNTGTTTAGTLYITQADFTPANAPAG